MNRRTALGLLTTTAAALSAGCLSSRDESAGPDDSDTDQATDLLPSEGLQVVVDRVVDGTVVFLLETDSETIGEISRPSEEFSTVSEGDVFPVETLALSLNVDSETRSLPITQSDLNRP